jgi:RNA polymerase sigma factor (sigma-70 family)
VKTLAVAHRATSAPDGVLVQESAAGGGESYAALYDRYSEQVYNYCLRLTGSPDDAADATQDAFVNVLRRLQDDDRPVLDFSSYLFAAARNESYALMRRRSRTHPVDEPPELAGAMVAAAALDVETDPERAVLIQDSQEQVRQANAQLAPRHREVLALREVAGRSYDEIGHIMGISENAAAQLIWRARAKMKEALTAGAVASVVAATEDCELAQLLLNRLEDGEPITEEEQEWLDEHLDECGSCKTANRMLLEVGASYRCWLPVALFAGMRTDTLTRAGELVGADWSHVPVPGKGAAGSSAGGGAGGGGAAAAATAAVTAAALAAAAIGGLALLRDDDPAAPVDAVAKQQPKAAEKPAQRPERDAKPAPAGGKLIASRAGGTFAAPVLAASPLGGSGPVTETAAPETGNAPSEPPGSNAPQDRPDQPKDNPGQPPGNGPESNSPGPPDPPAQPPVTPEPNTEPAAPIDSVPVKPVDPADPPVDRTDPPVDPTVPPTPLPDCTFPGRGTGPDECPPGHVVDPLDTDTSPGRRP